MEIPSLKLLMEEPLYSQLKGLFIQRRAEFNAHPKASTDLDSYQRGEDDYEYTVLKGLVPQNLIGKAPSGKRIPYKRSDTFFTNYVEDNPEIYILSSTDKSLVIANHASHDVRQYSAIFDSNNKDREHSAGMTYSHLLVIPRTKVYNIVALQDTEIIEEMIRHFQQFWITPGAIQKCIDRIQLAVNIRKAEIVQELQRNTETMTGKMDELDRVMKDVQDYVEICSRKLATLRAEDFIFGFHAAPDASVGHLHMHVLPGPQELRQYSTHAHDWKTIPAKAVVEVIQAEKLGKV